MTDSSSTATNAAVNGERSPIAQLLDSLGMTREDLSRHSAQMREFLTAENAKSLNASTCDQEGPAHNQLAQSANPQSPSRRTLDERNLTRRAVESNSSRGDKHDKPISSRRNTDARAAACVPPSSSPTRPKPSLDDFMQMHSNKSRRVFESEESEESESESVISEVVNSRNIHTSKSPGHLNTAQWSSNSQSVEAAAKAPQSFEKYPKALNLNPTSGDQSQQLPATPQGPSRNIYKTGGTISKNNSISPSKPGSSNKYYRKDYDKPLQVLPPSSPFASSPISSPIRAHNVVSSPGPMDSDPPDEDDPELPFRLPPGPYSEDKPDLSYAAIIGRAILASKTKGLRLKDIYDYISIVFPHFKRPSGNSHSQKWMNAIRQNLTNTPHFHKYERPNKQQHSKGPNQSRGSFWYIRDEDLPCFAKGSYNRHAVDPPQQARTHHMTTEVVTPEKKRKRKNKEEDSGGQPKKPKHTVKFPLNPNPGTNPYHFPYATTSQLPPGFVIIPGQPYYYVPQPMPDVLFPPLPPTHPQAHMIPAYATEQPDMVFPPLPHSRYITRAELAASSQSTSSRNSRSTSPDSDRSATPPPPSSASSCSMNIPALTPNNSSSPPLDDDQLENTSGAEEEPLCEVVTDDGLDLDAESISSMGDPLEPGIQLFPHGSGNNEGKGKQTESLTSVKLKPAVFPSLPPLPSTPTARGRKGKNAAQLMMPSTSSLLNPSAARHSPRPSTPPPKKRDTTASNASPVRTPKANKGCTLSPTRNLAHYKTSLHPPPALSFPYSDLLLGGESAAENDDMGQNRTPSRRRTTSGNGIFPSTPQRFGNASWNFSPFRTPSRPGVFDPHDPSALLDDELTRLGALETTEQHRLQDSPIGFFGHGKGLLYESPSIPTSPGQWRRPW